MNKLTVIPLLSVLSCSTLAYAGGMGDSAGLTGILGFASLEGGYAISSIDNYDYRITGSDIGAITSTITKQHYAARLAAGLMAMMDDQFGVTTELGWGYFGKATLNPPLESFGSLTIQHSIWGFDALIGIAFVQPSYSLSAKAGAMIQNMSTKTTAFSDLTLVDLGVESFASKVNQTAALPEIKLTAAYNFDPNWSITASYLGAFGSSSRASGSINSVTGAVSITTNNLNPSINAILLGMQYTC